MIDRLKTLRKLMSPWLLALHVVILVLAAGIGVAFETYDMILMSGKAKGVIRKMVPWPPEGKSHTYTYEFLVDGNRYESDRYMPGYLGNREAYPGIEDYKVGQEKIIHYCPENPQVCCLEYGFYNQSFLLFLVFAGSLGYVICGRLFLWLTGALPGRVAQSAVMAIALGGVLLTLFGPNVIHPSDLPWYALALAGLFVVILLVHFLLPVHQAEGT